MIKTNVEIKDNDLGLDKILERMNEIIKYRAETGFFQDKNVDGIGLAELMAIHEFGSKERNISERPAMRNTFDNSVNDIAEYMFELAGPAVIDGNISAEEFYIIVGDYYKSEFQNGITSKSLGLAENSPATIRRKKSDTPLVNEARLVNGIETRITKRGRLGLLIRKIFGL